MLANVCNSLGGGGQVVIFWGQRVKFYRKNTFDDQKMYLKLPLQNTQAEPLVLLIIAALSVVVSTCTHMLV